MKLRNLSALAILGLFVVTPAHAIVSQQIGIEGGASKPSGTFGDAAKTGYNLGAQYEVMVTEFGVGAEVRYHSWDASDNMKTLAGASDYRFTAWQYDVYGIVRLPMDTPMFSPYFRAGAGWYSPRTKLTTPTGDTSVSSNDFGVVAGTGFDFQPPGPMSFGVGIDYHRVKNSDTDFVSVAARVMWPLKLGIAP